MDLREMYLPAQEVAGFIRDARKRRRMSMLAVDRAADSPAGTCGRVCRSEGVVGAGVAERLLEAVGVDMWLLPTWEVMEEFSEAVRKKHRALMARNARCTTPLTNEQRYAMSERMSQSWADRNWRKAQQAGLDLHRSDLQAEEWDRHENGDFSAPSWEKSRTN